MYSQGVVVDLPRVTGVRVHDKVLADVAVDSNSTQNINTVNNCESCKVSLE